MLLSLIKRLAILGALLVPNIAFAQTCLTPPPLTQIVLNNIINICLPTNNANEISALALRQVLQTMTSGIFGSQLTTTIVTTRPNPVAAWPNGAFTGDNSKINYGINYSIVGAATLGQPTTGYVITPEASPIVGVFNNDGSGWNQSTSTNDGRTLAAFMQVYSQQNGQGDDATFFCDNQLNSTRVGATSWLASPASTCIVAQLAPSVNNGFLNPANWVVFDNGFDTAVIMESADGNRSNATSAIGQVWLGTFWESTGTIPWDAFYSGIGQVKVGIDLTNITTQSSGLVHAGIILKGGDCQYFNGTPGTSPKVIAASTGGDSICYSSGSMGLIISTGGSSAFEVISGQNASVNFFNALMGLSVTGAGVEIGSPTGGDKGEGTLNIQGAVWTNGVVGASCTLTTVSHLTVVNGIVTLCD